MDKFVFHPAQQYVMREMKKPENKYGLVLVGRAWGKTELADRYPMHERCAVIRTQGPQKRCPNIIYVRCAEDFPKIASTRYDLYVVDEFSMYDKTLACDLFHTLRERNGKILFLGTPKTMEYAQWIWDWPVWDFKYSFGTKDNWSKNVAWLETNSWKSMPDNEYRMLIEGKFPIDNL